MIPVDITVKNYRCFPESSPLRLMVAEGFTACVGINNAGKSSILKLFWELQPIFSFLGQPSNNFVGALGGQPQPNASPRVGPGEQLSSKLNEGSIEIDVEWLATDHTGRSNIKHSVTIVIPRPYHGFTLRASLDDEQLGGGYAWAEGTRLTASGNISLDLQPMFDMCSFLGRSMYLGPFRNAINVGASEPYFDIAVGQQFTGQFHQFKSGADPTANEDMYRLIQDLKRIFGFNELDINPGTDGKTLQVFIDGRSFRLSELGSGLAQFILVMANVLVRKPTLVLIDEPETSLHPALQLDFLTTLASYATAGSVIFATHNLGLARAASDRIYSCRRVELGVSEVRELESTPRLGEFLGELGFSAYQDLGFDSVLLVEGPSEVKVMQQFLRALKKDHQVVLLPLGGSSMINGKAEPELVEVQRISPKVSIIIDSERTTRDEPLAADRQAFVELCAKLNIPLLVLDRRATENYLTDSAVKRGLGAGFTALGPFDSLRAASPGWSKRDNWRAARHMVSAEFADTDLGKFLETL